MLRSPCAACPRQCGDRYCEAYRLWVKEQWARFRGRYMAAYRERLSGDKFYYAHPDELRRYLREGVCGGCPARRVCENPCPAYWRWWDARMERLKGGNLRRE